MDTNRMTANEVVAAPSEIADAIAWLKSGEAMMGPRTEKAVSVLLDAHASALRDSKRLDWLLPNLAPANFGMGFEWDTDADFLAGWRKQIDAAIGEKR